MLRTIARGSLAALAVAALGCGSLGLGKSGPDPAAARIGKEVITVSELDAQIKDDLWKRETGDGNPARVYELRSAAAKSLVARRALDAEAKRRGLTTEALLDEEYKKLPPVDDAAVKSFYDQNAAQLQGAPLDAIAPRIKQHLEGEAKRQAIDALLAKADTQVLLERPRVEVRPGGQSRGPADARVTVVEFSDFQCPFCQRAKPVLDEIATRHPNDVRIVYRNLPLDALHPRARASAEAAACAAEGNKFWEYHDKLFANNRALGDEDLRKYAKEVGLDAKAFDECVKARRHKDEIDADVEEARKIGITGTPAFVVNGIMMFGLQTADSLDTVIREELGKSGKAGS
jgi:predicted DsbA family dithiol-disulfide isomerase